MKFLFKLNLILILNSSSFLAQQVEINRINQMPDFPVPYEMRDWKSVTLGYDSLVFNHTLQGDYLPLIYFENNTVNYPNDISFGLHTVVGTTVPNSGEAINVLPAVIGASLVDVDKSNQNGYNWVKMCKEYFNNRPAQNVYKNHPVDDTYDDWWYETMPNVFFYQLYDLYPNTIDFDMQLKSVADQWLKSVEQMGGKSNPWSVPYMNYRGYDLETMTPYSGGVKEPEAAGAIAWILYNAYKETNEIKYRIGAEWSMEYLNSLSSNPSYELQLGYGVYTAARMNAELGTNYDIVKLINWCFDIGSLRSWGSIIGNWGGLDVSGLIGEVNGNNDYAFLMNTFELASALVPLVKYDDRFANAIGKWMLNASNASRLFYTNYLPNYKQDSEEWSHKYDTKSYIAHEAIRESVFGTSPYATGDAISGAWGSTNLALYGSSHVGIFGGIIDTTNVKGIIKLDLNKTDYFNEHSYPTYLFYNPYETEKSVEFDFGNLNNDLYELVSNNFIMSSASGNVQLNIPPKSAIVVTLVPTGSEKKIDMNKFTADGIVVDFNSGQNINNHPPRIKALTPQSIKITTNDSIKVFCTAVDLDNDQLNYIWKSEDGKISAGEDNIIWTAPNKTGTFQISVMVNDNNGGVDSLSTFISVIESFNDDPVILNFNAEPRKIDLGDETQITCFATDDDGDELIYEWKAENGIVFGSGETIKWTAPNTAGNYFISCKVSDGNGGIVQDSIAVSVRDLSNTQSGSLICFYPFSGNADDKSGNNNNGTISGAVFVSDRFGNSNNALNFDGVNDYVKITNSNSLNFTNSISINLWFKINSFYEREQYIISHGNWERRWKISISNNKLRFTIKTASGITDLDSETNLVKDKLYNITALYSGAELEIYLNGKLDAFKNWSGAILTTDIDLTIAQTVPGNNNYNFNGIIDDVRIYDYALSLYEIVNLYDLSTSVNENEKLIPEQNFLYQNYPNPFNGTTNIKYQISQITKIELEIYNLLGQKIKTLVNEQKSPGYYSLTWDGINDNGTFANSGIYFIRLHTDTFNASAKLVYLK
ncbi:MAG: T9SS type A sorting domain-containing protein [Ignavibacteriales bacterium]|nr:T9SS type A sorting domain-containing protein [Ignavibacteriales bacterium]